MLGIAIRLVIALVLVVLITRFVVRAMRSYVQGADAELRDRGEHPGPTIEVTGDLRLRCETCGFEVQVLRVPESDDVPYQLKPVNHCREEMVIHSDVENL